jgi:hypothetical protein
MARVRALRDCYIDQIRLEGEEFDYTGPKNENLAPTKKAKADADLAEAQAESAAAEAEEKAAK